MNFPLMETLIKNRPRQYGLTLVELIIALALGMVLMGGITRVFIENKKNYVKDEEFARLQENGRNVISMFKHEVKMSGFMGGAGKTATAELVSKNNKVLPLFSDCVADIKWALATGSVLPNSLETIPQTIDFLNDIKDSIPVSSAGVKLNCLKVKDVQVGTDALVIKRTLDTVSSSNGIWVGGERKNSWYLKIKNSPTDSPIISAEDLNYKYVGSSGLTSPEMTQGEFWDMWLYSVNIFYVRKYSSVPPSKNNPCGDCIPTLVTAALQGNSFIHSALFEGVEAIQIEFGVPKLDTSTLWQPWVDQSETPETFYSNPNQLQLARATVVRIYVLMRTVNPIVGYIDNKSYTLGTSLAYTPNDNYMRRIFSTTIQLRN